MPSPSIIDLVRRSRSRDYRIIQGATWARMFSFPSDWGADWTGFAARAEFRRGPRTRNPQVLATARATIIDPGPTNRIVHLVLDADITAAIIDKRGTWDLEIYNGSVVLRIAQGQWHLSEETTAQ